MLDGSMVALITPFTNENKIDDETLYDLVRWHVAKKTDAIVCCGTTGEAPTLSKEEKIRVIKMCLEAASGEIPIIAGTGSYSTKSTIEMTSKAYDLGVDACLVVVPYYNKPTQEGCILHFEEVNKVGAKIIVYHHPGRTGVNLTLSTFALLEEMKNIIAIKEASSDLDFAKGLIEKNSLPVLSGDDSLTFPMMKYNAKGVISVVANCIPSKMKQLVKACKKKDYLKAKAISDEIEPLCRAMALETNPQCVKYALSIMGKCLPHLRLPLIEPSEMNKTIIQKAIENL